MDQFGGPFLKVPVVLFLYLWANVMELNTKWFHCIETFRTLKNEKLRNEVSWGRCAGAERLDFHTAGVSGSSPLMTLDLYFSFIPRPLDPSSVPLLYILSRRAESHGLAFMCMWHYQNAHMTVHQLWLLTKWHRKTFRTSSRSDMTFFQDFTSLENMPDTPALSPLYFFFFPRPSPPSLAKSRLVDVRLSCERRCYLLLTWQGHEFWSKVKLILLSKA